MFIYEGTNILVSGAFLKCFSIVYNVGFVCQLSLLNWQNYSIFAFCQIYRVTDDDSISETAV